MSGTPKKPLLLSVLSLTRNGDLLRRAANLLRRGGLVAFPSDCGYAVAARGDDAGGLGRLAELMERPPGRPWTLYAADAGQGLNHFKDPDEVLRRVAEVLWPGPLTVLARRGEGLPESVHCGLAKVAVHVPAHRLARAFLDLCRCPVVGVRVRPPRESLSLSREMLLEFHGPRLEAILEGQEPPGNLELSVLDLAGPIPRLVRQGFLGVQDFQRLLGRPPLLSSDLPTPARFTRYSPEARLVVVEGESDRVAHRLKFMLEAWGGRESALLVTSALAQGALAGLPGLEVMPGPDRPEELAGFLFGRIQSLEARDSMRLILVEGLPREGPAAAVMERLVRVAHQVINTEDPGYDGQGGLQPRIRRR